MRVAVVGSRTLTVPNLGDYLPENVSEIVSGGARGVDQCARLCPFARHQPDGISARLRAPWPQSAADAQRPDRRARRTCAGLLGRSFARHGLHDQALPGHGRALSRVPRSESAVLPVNERPKRLWKAARPPQRTEPRWKSRKAHPEFHGFTVIFPSSRKFHVPRQGIGPTPGGRSRIPPQSPLSQRSFRQINAAPGLSRRSSAPRGRA